ncbi:hypothetical protein [Streptomyces sp. NPDC005096]|uniref:hypothetical protein n=1 Tax=Streptomyces sp. NPDC005096 TaxID=3154559 RepID=UPI00339F973A
MGNFFPGRTDHELLTQLALSPAAEEVVIFGCSEEVSTRLQPLISGRQVRLLGKRPLAEIARIVGSKTVLAVPHVVSDYTVSQDLMKAYQGAALGMRVLLPYELFPAGLGPDQALALGPGVKVDDVLDGAFARGGLNPAEVDAFMANNSWERRAQQVRELLDES